MSNEKWFYFSFRTKSDIVYRRRTDQRFFNVELFSGQLGTSRESQMYSCVYVHETQERPDNTGWRGFSACSRRSVLFTFTDENHCVGVFNRTARYTIHVDGARRLCRLSGAFVTRSHDIAARLSYANKCLMPVKNGVRPSCYFVQASDRHTVCCARPRLSTAAHSVAPTHGKRAFQIQLASCPHCTAST